MTDIVDYRLNAIEKRLDHLEATLTEVLDRLNGKPWRLDS